MPWASACPAPFNAVGSGTSDPDLFFPSGGLLVELALAKRKDSIEGGGAREPQVSTPVSIGGEHVNM